MFGKKDDDRPTSRGALLIAVAVSVVVGVFVPFGGVLLYPFTLLATWVHEMGHGLTALALGGGFDHLEIFANASGLAHTHNASGAVDALVCLGGLVAPPIAGAVMLATARGPRRAHVCLPTGVGSPYARTCMKSNDCLHHADCVAAPDGVRALVGTIGPVSQCAPWGCAGGSATTVANGLTCIYGSECSDDADCPKGHCAKVGGRPTCQPGARSQCPPPP